jgi:streptogramin lyase
MNDLETLLEPLIESAPEPAPVAVVRGRAARIRRRRRVRSAALSAVVVVTLVAAVVIALPRNRDDVGTVAPSSTSTTTTTTAPRPVSVGTPHPVDQFSMDVLAAYGSLWSLQPDRVVRLDPVDGHVAATVPVPGESDERSLAVGAGSIWVDDTGTAKVTRIDPRTNRVVATIPLLEGFFDPDGIAFLDGLLWVARPQPMGLYGDIVGIDPATNRIVRRSSQTSTPRTFYVIAGSGALWFTGGGSGYELERFDTRTLKTRVTREGVMAIVGVSPGRLWLQTARGVIEIDERTGAQIGPRIAPRGGLANVTVAVSDGVAWVASQPDSSHAGSITPYDAVTHRIVGATTALGLPIMEIVPTPGAVWVSIYQQQGLTRIPYSR